ncbi:B12-binding domain-containing radical SAM protein [Arenicellales bacterium nBUS_45]
MKENRIVFLKPPDRFLEDEFVYQQLGPHFLQSYLQLHGIQSDILVLYEKPDSRSARLSGETNAPRLQDLGMLLLKDGVTVDIDFNISVFENYDVVGMSVMTPQAPDAYLLNMELKSQFPNVTTVIGGSHPRYYQNQVETLPPSHSFDFIVPQDGWEPILQIATGQVTKADKSQVLVSNLPKLEMLPPPTRPIGLLEKYQFKIAGAPAFHTITALGCPFTCHFCESGIERVRMFSEEMVTADLDSISSAQKELGYLKSAVMFFDDVGLMSPKQVEKLSALVAARGFDTWRAFTHAYLVVKHKERLLNPFVKTGGRRIGLGIETGSQRSLDMINKRNGKSQSVSDHFEAIRVANDLGIAVDAFTMIYPWEDEEDLRETTKLVEFVASNKVNGIDIDGRPLMNHVDSTIMSPFQGTKFYDLIRLGKIPDVAIDLELDPGTTFYKGEKGGSGWPYLQTKLPKEEYEAAQKYRNSLRPKYR